MPRWSGGRKHFKRAHTSRDPIRGVNRTRAAPGFRVLRPGKRSGAQGSRGPHRGGWLR
jgi:hypothetical protein